MPDEKEKPAKKAAKPKAGSVVRCEVCGNETTESVCPVDGNEVK